MKLILGSSSKYRKDILEKAGYIFEVVNPDVEEKEVTTKDPRKRSIILAHLKADTLVKKVKEPSLLITCDIIVMCNGKMREKPESEEQARQFLKEYSQGGVPEMICALVVTNTETGKRYDGIDITKAFFNPYPDSVIEHFIKEGEPLTRAGGFAIQHPVLRPYLRKIEGTEESIIGMPVHLLAELLKKAGYNKIDN